MTRFLDKLNTLTQIAEEQGILKRPTTLRLLELAKTLEEGTSRQLLIWAFGIIAAVTCGTGVIFLIASHWHTIPPFLKVSGLLVLLLASSSLGIFAQTRHYSYVAEAFYVVNALLVLAGIGLMSQIFNMQAYDGRAYYFWFILIAPIAVMTYSRPLVLLCFMAIIAGILADHLYPWPWDVLGGPGIYFITKLLCLYTATLILSLLRFLPDMLRRFLQYLGTLSLLGGVYILGFYRFFYSHQEPIFVPGLKILLFLMVVYFALGIMDFKRTRDRFRLIHMILCLSINGLIIAAFIIPTSEILVTFPSFGSMQQVPLNALLITGVAWFLWFAFGFWGMIYGTVLHRGLLVYLSMGLILLGLLTRFIDVAGTLLTNGLVFVGVGVLIFALTYGLERWSKRLSQERTSR